MKNTRFLITLSICCVITQHGFAQDQHLSSAKGETTLGLGLGLPYGALGARLGVNIMDELNLFGGVGYQISGVGYNVGLLKDFPSARQTQFYLTGMYGTNAAIKVDGASEYDKVYTGATFGAGIKVNSRSTEGNYWDFGLLVPLRSSAFEDDETLVKNDPRVSEFTEASPVLIIVGYNFNFR